MKPCESRHNKGYMRYVVQKEENSGQWFATVAGFAIPVWGEKGPFGTYAYAVGLAAQQMFLRTHEYRDAAKRYGLRIKQAGVKPYNQ